MSKVKFAFIVLVCCHNCLTIENKLTQTTEILFNLTNYAIESRRIRNHCIYETSDDRYFECMKQLTGHYGSQYQSHYTHHQKPITYPHLHFRPQRYPNFHRPQDSPQNIMDVLYTISKNDALRCVPRLLCEVTSDTISRNRQSFSLPTLPLNFDMSSIIKLLATIDLPGGSPIPVFAKAALLGYVSKGNSDSCQEAYPTCPRDPNKLVQYLNNYNGGFFRYFNGVDAVKQNYQNLMNYPQYQYKSPVAQERIQTRPVHHVTNNEAVIFDSDTGGNFVNRLPKTLSFPTEDDNRFSPFTLKKPKELPFSINEYYSNELDLQRPLPNHRATPIIFPTRTGTGDLRLDAEDLDSNYGQKHYYQNNFVSFRPEQSNDDAYYKVPEGLPGKEYNPNKAVFSFPI